MATKKENTPISNTDIVAAQILMRFSKPRENQKTKTVWRSFGFRSKDVFCFP